MRVLVGAHEPDRGLQPAAQPRLEREPFLLALLDDPPLYAAIRTIFRALPRRLAPGTVLYVATHDKSGGDVELFWEARDAPSHASDPDALLREGPYGDLLAVAILGLDEICRARRAIQEEPGELGARRGEAEGKVRRRYLFLIPEQGCQAPRGA